MAGSNTDPPLRPHSAFSQTSAARVTVETSLQSSSVVATQSRTHDHARSGKPTLALADVGDTRAGKPTLVPTLPNVSQRVSEGARPPLVELQGHNIPFDDARIAIENIENEEVIDAIANARCLSRTRYSTTHGAILPQICFGPSMLDHSQHALHDTHHVHAHRHVLPPTLVRSG